MRRHNLAAMEDLCAFSDGFKKFAVPNRIGMIRIREIRNRIRTKTFFSNRSLKIFF